jgi:PilZ domain
MSSINQRFVTNERASIEVYGRRSSVMATLKNLSQTGACLTWAQEGVRLETGDLVCLIVELGALKKRHKVTAEVIWRRDKETGVTFIPKEELVEKFVSKTKATNSVY